MFSNPFVLLVWFWFSSLPIKIHQDEAYYTLIKDSYQSSPEFIKLLDILSSENSSHELIASLPPWLFKTLLFW
jgi:hypothetical protein